MPKDRVSSHQAGTAGKDKIMSLPEDFPLISGEFKLGARVLVISELHQLGLTVLKIFDILNGLFKIGRLPGLDTQGVMDLFQEAKLQCLMLIDLGDEVRDLLSSTVLAIEEKMLGPMNEACPDLNEIVRLSAEFSESMAIVSEEVGKEMRCFDRTHAEFTKSSFQIDGLRPSVQQTVRDISCAMDRLDRMMRFLKRSIASDFNLVEECDVTLHEFGKLRLYWPVSDASRK